MRFTRARKLDILKFFGAKEVVTIMDLVNEWGYSYGSAQVTLYRLEKTKLIEKLGITPGQYCLTNLGYKRLEYLERREKEIIVNSSPHIEGKSVLMKQ